MNAGRRGLLCLALPLRRLKPSNVSGMNRILTFLTCAAGLLLAACASTVQRVPMPDQTKVVENPAKGRIYVMRPSDAGSTIRMDIVDGADRIGHTGPGGYLCWERDPGDVVVASRSENTSRVSLVVRPGTVHYILQHIRMGIWLKRTDLEVVEEERGRTELKKCKPARVEPR